MTSAEARQMLAQPQEESCCTRTIVLDPDDIFDEDETDAQRIIESLDWDVNDFIKACSVLETAKDLLDDLLDVHELARVYDEESGTDFLTRIQDMYLEIETYLLNYFNYET